MKKPPSVLRIEACAKCGGTFADGLCRWDCPDDAKPRHEREVVVYVYRFEKVEEKEE